MKISNNTKGSLYNILSAFSYSTFGIWSNLLGESLGIYFQAWTRSLLTLFIIIPIGFLVKSYSNIRKKDRVWFVIVSISSALFLAPYYYAINNLNIGTTTLLFYAAVVITQFIIGKLFFKEELGIIKIASLVLSVIGLYLVFSFSVPVNKYFAACMAAFSGIAVGCEITFSKKISNRYSTLQILIAANIAIVLTHIPITLLTKDYISNDWNITIAGVQIAYTLANLFGLWFAILAFKYVQPSIGALIGMIEVVFAVGWGVALFNEAITISTVVGATLIIIAASLPNAMELIEKRKREK